MLGGLLSWRLLAARASGRAAAAPMGRRGGAAVRAFATPPVGGSGGGGAVEGAQGSQAADAWRADTGKYWEIHKLKGGRQPQKDFKMGPYAHEMRRDPATGKLYPVAKFFVSPRKDPVTFIVNSLCVLVTVWTISQLSWGESFFEKRRRVIRERIRQEYGLPKGWEHEIDDEGDLELSEISPGGLAAAASSRAAAAAPSAS
mmetsp:Transcript_116581/g.326135  ORF Transcript_116581/g.326135 Transcript_116581/m.326135 type:complete len:201 (-) Transcript_116581:34-636(-)